MKSLKIYTFIRKLNPQRFDYSCFIHLVEHLEKRGYKVERIELDGDDGFVYKNDCEVMINQGSISIFEYEDGGFKVWDCGDHPNLTLQLHKSKNFMGAAIGQYNKKLWDDTIPTSFEKRMNIVPGIHFEQFWQYGVINYDNVQEYRKNITLDNRLLWRGSLYENCPNQNEYQGRRYISHLTKELGDKFAFGDGPLPFDEYIHEAIHFKLVLDSGVGGGYCCGDYCFKDAEMYGLGIPTIRPKYAIQPWIPLIPDYHYISIDVDFDERFKYKNHEAISEKIAKRYNEVINDDDHLKYISDNARQWYMSVLSYPVVINNIINSLSL